MIRVLLASVNSPPDLGGWPLAGPVRLVLRHDGAVETVTLPRGCTPAQAALLWRQAADNLQRRFAAWRAVGDPASWPEPPARRAAVSVVVGTKDRGPQLRRCLAAVRALLGPGDELTVVDNSASGTARRVAEEAGARWLPEPRPGVAFARNAGAAAAGRAVVVFLDDDGVADSCLLDAIAEPFADPDVVAVTGAVLGRDPSSAVGRLFDERYPFFRGWRMRRFAGSTGTRRSPFDTWRVGTGAAMAWRVDAFRDLGGFDPALGEGTPAGGTEDLDMFRRALAAGSTIVYTPRAVLWHDHPTTRAELRRKMTHYAVTDAAHATKVTVETGQWGAARMVSRQWTRLPRRVAVESGRRLRGRSALPVAPLLADPVLAVSGAVRFLRYRAGLRALAAGPNQDGPDQGGADQGSSASRASSAGSVMPCQP